MTENDAPSPTVALVHGAFADAGSFAGVTELLLAAGVKVQALVNPLRGIAFDSAYVASALSQIPGPVLAVGHSYGGAIISNAATSTPNVIGLVFVAAFAPDENEVLSEVEGTSRDSALGPALVQAHYPTGNGDETAIELYVNPAAFHEVFASDIDEAQAGVLGASPRPVAAAAFDEKSGVPAWKSLPSWAVVATGDKAAGSDVILSMASAMTDSTAPADALARKLHRTELQHQTSSIPGRNIVQVLTEIPAGVESGWHTHPGEEVGYILAGTVKMMIEGKPTLILHAGDPFLMPPGQRHNALDIGPETGRMLSTYIVRNDEPLSVFTAAPSV